MELRLIVMALLCLAFAQVAFGYEDEYNFATNQQKSRFVRLTKEIRCSVCQNQNLFESNSALADSLRKQIYYLININYSDQKIRDYLREKHGAHILFRTPINFKTSTLWFSPLLMLLAGGLLFWRYTSFGRAP